MYGSDGGMSEVQSPFSADEFPKFGIVPKRETQVLQFLEKYPECDGRGVIVGILDTGCDPLSEGLTQTSEGKPKFVDCVDCTGNGDVDTSTIVKAEDGVITGLSGRKLKLDPSWENPSAEWRVGLLRAYDVFPSAPKKRLEKSRNEKWKERHKQALDKIRSEIVKLQQSTDSDGSGDASDPIEKAKSAKELESKAEDLELVLNELSKEKACGSGPICDVVCWFDGSDYRAILETSLVEDYYEARDIAADLDPSANVIDLSVCKVMRSFRIAQDCALISQYDCLTYNLNVYDHGSVVSVVTPSGSHGTHVAGIIGACFSDDPSRNGMAPGIQMVSLKIGDGRLGTMETNQGLLRSIEVLRSWNCHLANMSYGEPTTNPKTSVFVQSVDELVYNNNLVFCAAAGNDGPALGTSGAAQVASKSMIGIGAVFSPSMIQAGYGLVDVSQPPGVMNAYSWTSRGPGSDGSMGVKVCAPGAAITAIPKYTLSKNQMMNGTSMACPNCCGNIALLISAMLKKGQNYTSVGLEKAVINSARKLDALESNAQGYGMIQVLDAWRYLEKFGESIMSPQSRMTFDVSISGGGIIGSPQNNDRGIYIRGVPQSLPKEGGSQTSRINGSGIVNYWCSIKPKFPRIYESQHRIDFEANVILQSVQFDWIRPPKSMVIPSAGRMFQIEIDLAGMNSSLPSAAVLPTLQTEVVAFDARRPREFGPLFRVPITIARVVQPDCKGMYQRQTVFQRSGQTDRVFLNIPLGVSHARVRIEASESDEVMSDSTLLSGPVPKKNQLTFFFATMFLNKSQPVHFDRYLRLSPGSEQDYTLTAQPGTCMEFNLTQRALSVGSLTVRWSIELCGPSLIDSVGGQSGDVSGTSIAINTGDCYSSLCFTTGLYPAIVHKPSVEFDTFSRYLSPDSAEMKLLSRDRGDLDFTASGIRQSSSEDGSDSYVEVKADEEQAPDSAAGAGESMYALRLDYSFDQTLSSSGSVSVSPLFPFINNLLYDCGASYQGGFWQLVNAKTKEVLLNGETYKQSVKLPSSKKGSNTYLIRYNVRCNSVSACETLKKTATLRLDFTLSKKVSTSSFFRTKSDLHSGSGIGGSSLLIRPFSHRPLILATSSLGSGLDKNILGQLQTGDHLRGWLNPDTVTYGSEATLKPYFRANGTTNKASFCFPVICNLSGTDASDEVKAPNSSLSDLVKSAVKASAEKSKPKKESTVTIEEGKRDALIAFVSKLSGEDQIQAFEEIIVKELMPKFSDDLDVLNLQLQVWEKAKAKATDADDSSSSSSAAGFTAEELKSKRLESIDALLTAIDLPALRSEMSILEPKTVDGDSADLSGEYKRRKEQTQKRLSMAVAAQISRLKVIRAGVKNEDEPDPLAFAEFEKCWTELSTWKDTSKGDEFKEFAVFIAKQRGLVGKQLKLSSDTISKERKDGSVSESAYDGRTAVIKQYFGDDFSHVVSERALNKRVLYPQSYPIF